MDFVVSVNYKASENEIKWKDKILDSCQRTKKAVKHKGDSNTTCS